MNRSLIKKYYIIIILFTAFGGLFLLPNTILAETRTYEKLFYIVNGKNGIASFKNNVSSIDVIAPQSYTLDSNLSVTGAVSDEIKNVAKGNGVKVVPLICNAGFSQKIIHNLLVSSTTTQDRVINFLITEAIKNNYTGWQFDFEHIYYKDKDIYSTFIERTSKAFKNSNLSLSIAAVSRSDDVVTDFYKNWSGSFDYERIAKSVDFISIMTYDDPKSKGPVASMPYVNSVYDYLKNKVPPEKLSLGIPFYYWGWQVSPLVKVRSSGTYERLAWLRQTYKVSEGFSDVYKVPFLKYWIGKNQYIVWHEDAKSLESKFDLVKQNNLRGISAWVLGLEDPSVWTAIKTL